MPYAIMRFAKRKAGGVASTERHNERKKDSYQSNPDIDTSRSHLNYHLATNACTTYSAAIDRRTEDVGCRRRKDSVTLVETLFTASPEFIEAAGDDGREFFERAYQFSCKQFGADNIVSAVVHMDETTPHMHLVFVPVTPDGRLSAKDILGNKKSMCKWQDRYHAFMSERWPELQRGTPAIETKRKHLPVWLFKAAERLDVQYEQVKAALSDINAFNSGKKRDEALELLAAWVPEAKTLTAQVKSVDGEIARLTDGVFRVAGENQELRGQNYSLEEELLESKYRAYQLKKQLEKQERLLAKLPPELLEQLTHKPKQRGQER
ncbi:MAG: plasmid recombination protein [Coriobacteriales bacterium]|nr:plasmid recombination protein [Coriobacteriales bacterium]